MTIQNLQKQLEKMAGELSGLLAAGLVSVDDGLTIVSRSLDPAVDADVPAAYLSALVKTNLRAMSVLAEGETLEDIVVSTGSARFLARYEIGQPFFVFLMTKNTTWLGKSRALLDRYHGRFTTMLKAYLD
jgi:predicted regulator of Ras-like GTPase activity (Roadblock/LC7/MglB family)